MNNTTHFDLAAKTWDTEETVKRNEVIAREIKKNLTNPIGRLMDFGCGTGLLTSHFINMAHELIGIETSLGMLDQYHERFKDVTKVTSLAMNIENESLPTTIGSFDVIITAMAFHHLKNPEQVLRIFKNHLNINGQIFIIDLDEEDGSFHPDNKGMGVYHFGFSKNKFESWFRDLGFKSFKHETVFQIFKNNRTYNVCMGIFE